MAICGKFADFVWKTKNKKNKNTPNYKVSLRFLKCRNKKNEKKKQSRQQFAANEPRFLS